MDFTKLRNYLFLGLLLSVSALFFYLLKPFAYPIFWAAVIAGLFYPFYQRLNRRLKSENLSSLITLVLVTCIIIIPLLVVSMLVFNEILNAYGTFNDNRNAIIETLRTIATSLQSNPLLERLNINQEMLVDRFQEVSNTVISYLFSGVKNITQNSFTFAAQFVLMLYTLFFFLRDGEEMLRKLMYLMPLGDKYEKILYSKFTAAARASLKGTLIVGVIQGLLGGLLFAVLGVPGTLILTVLMIMVSLIPALGPFLIWWPVAMILMLTGHLWKGIIIISVGTIVIGTIDNFLRPMLVGKDIKMHPLIILFTTLGGLTFFGISGFIIGPIVAALFLTFWEMYQHYYQAELADD